MTAQLHEALADVLTHQRVLVCCDYDGTLAPIVPDPEQAFPYPGVPAALAELAALPGIVPALVSGRALVDLRRLSGVAESITCVGSHGAEFVSGEFAGFGSPEKQRLAEITNIAANIVADVPGPTIEIKPVSVAVHVRRANAEDGAAVLDQVKDQILGRPGIFVTRGKAVVEIAVVHADKGDAIMSLKRDFDTAAAIFVGDDVTDERGFEKLDQGDLGIKVGAGETAAQFRVADPSEVLGLLHAIVRLRTG